MLIKSTIVNQIGKLCNWNCSVKTWMRIKGAGKFSGLIIKEIIDEVDKSKKHATAKKLEKLFEGFDPEDDSWIKFTLQCFADIFMM